MDENIPIFFQDLDADENYLNNIYSSLNNSEHSQYYTVDRYNDTFASQSSLLRIFHANVRSYRANGEIFDSLLGSLTHSPQIFSLTETRFDINSMHLCQYEGYDGFHTVRSDENRGGGVSVFVDSRFSASKLPDLSICDETIETCAIKLKCNEVPLIVIGIYRPHTDSIPNFISKLINILTHDLIRNHKTVLIGDLNVNLLLDDTQINSFLTEMQLLSFVPLISKPTRFPPGDTETPPSLLDHVWTNAMVNCNSGIIFSDVSDHLPIFLHLSIESNLPSSKKIQFRYFDDSCMENLLCDISALDWNDIFCDNINLSMAKFEEVINYLYCKNSSLKTKYISYKRLSKPWMTSAIFNSIKTKSKLFKLVKLGKFSKISYNNFKNRLTSVLRSAKNSYYKNIFRENAKNSKKIWSTFRNLFGTYKNNKRITEIKINNSSLVDDREMANAFNEYFASVGKNLDESLPRSNSNFQDFLPNSLPHSFFLTPVSPEEISVVILKMKRKKSDLNSLPVNLLVKCRNLLSTPLAKLINMSFSSGIFPDSLKRANIVPIHKSGSRTDIRKYRPISILPMYSKIFEKCMYTRLVSYLKNYDLISPFQFGFQAGKNTSDAALNFLSKIYESLNNNLHSIGIFLDFKNAFDTVNYNILLKKLSLYGIRGVANDWFRSYLSNRQQRVKLNNTYSDFKSTNVGVPQGSTLGPLLFLVYVNDIHKASKLFDFTLFADDTSLTISNKCFSDMINTVNSELQKVFNWTLCNRLTLNLEKTVFMIFGFKNYDIFNNPILLNNVQLEIVEELKFLGIVLDPKLKFDKHIGMISKKLSKSVGIFYKVRYLVPENLMLILYYSLVYPYLLYAISIWGGTYPTHLQPLIIIQKRVIRLITNQNFLAHSSPLFLKTKVLKLPDIYKLILAQIAFSSDVINNFRSNHTHNTRNRNALQPAFQRLSVCQNSLNYNLPLIWNELPLEVKSEEKYSRFKMEVKRFFLSKYES